MKKILFTIQFFLLFANSYSQVSTDWISTANTYSKLGSCMVVDSAENVYVAGHDQSILLRKYNAMGNQIWEVSSTSGIQFNYEDASQVYLDPQGNPIVVGYRYTLASGSDYGHLANSIIILKYDTGGNLIYKQNFDGKFYYFSNSKFWAKVNSQMDASGNLFIGSGGFLAGYPDSGFTAIKVSPGGTIDWVRTKTFPGTFYYVNSLYLINDLIGLEGTTLSSSGNASTWVLDTTGMDKWNNVSYGEGGKDISFDNNGNAYILTWGTIASSADIIIEKFDSNGNLLWNQNYDFGGHEISTSMEFTSDHNLVVMAYGNTYPGNSLYTDWIILKIDLNGSLLWSKRYDEHTKADELPFNMRVDQNNNIYLTGLGGPFPGGFNLSKTQFVTVKYDSNGNLLWSALVDTLIDDNYGLDIAFDNQNGLYVLGLSWSILIHYLDQSITDISSPSSRNSFSVFPNPAKSSLHIVLSGWKGMLSVEVYDLSGKLIHIKNSNAPNTAEMDVSQMESGVYFLKIKDESGRTELLKWNKI